MGTYKSGAFIQQCYSVHPRCLTLQKFTQPDFILFNCTSCRLAHRVTLRDMTTRLPVARASEGGKGSDEHAVKHLEDCIAAHALALSVREMDVVKDWLGLRCAECRRLYDLNVAAFETQQR